MSLFDIKIPPELYTIKHIIVPEDWAPGVWAGCEGIKLTITKIDLETRTITLELISTEENND